MLDFNLAVAGLGTVGAEVVRQVQSRAAHIAARSGVNVKVVAVSARDRAKDRGISLKNIEWVENPVELAARPDVHAVVELMGGENGPPVALCEAAIAAGKHVITANKAMLALYGGQLAEAAERKGCALAFEAAVAGGIPALKAVREGLAVNEIRRVTGILNGTCNYILTEMKRTGRDFSDILTEAQAKGYAEADPSLDIDGGDTAHKLAVLSAIAFGVRPDFGSVHIEGIRDVAYQDIQNAEEMGYEIKLLGMAEREEGRISQRVHPALVPAGSPIASVWGVYNAVMVEAEPVGTLMLEGRGAGAGPTASAVLADIIDIACGQKRAPFGLPASRLGKLEPQPLERIASAYYLRLEVNDQPGVLADITSLFRDFDISVKSIVQKGRAPGETVQVVIVTHRVREAAMLEAVRRISSLRAVEERPKIIRIVEGT